MLQFTSASHTLACSPFSSLVLSCSVAIAASFLIAPVQTFAAQQPSIKIVSGAEQRTTYSAPFPKPLQVVVTDSATHKPLAGVLVDFTAAAGLAVGSSSAITNRLGLASVTATGTAVGSSSVEASVEGFSHAKVRFESLKVVKAVLVIVPADQNSTVGVVPSLREYQLTGFMNGETPESAHITGTPLLTTVATDHSRDANYAIKGWPGTLSSPNYTFAPGFGTLVLSGTRASADAEEEKEIVAPVAQETAATIQPALNSTPAEKVESTYTQQVQNAVPVVVSTSQTKASASTGSIRAAVPSNSAASICPAANAGAVRATRLPSATSGNSTTASFVVRSTTLEHTASNETLPSTRRQVAKTGLKAPGSN